jgi:hypothetical protein
MFQYGTHIQYRDIVSLEAEKWAKKRGKDVDLLHKEKLVSVCCMAC